MTAESTKSTSRVPAATANLDLYLPFPLPAGSRSTGMAGLSGHVRALHKRNQGISRWLAFAVLGGAIVAFAMVQFAIH
jgi:hypothetical protein